MCECLTRWKTFEREQNNNQRGAVGHLKQGVNSLNVFVGKLDNFLGNSCTVHEVCLSSLTLKLYVVSSLFVGIVAPDEMLRVHQTLTGSDFNRSYLTLNWDWKLPQEQVFHACLTDVEYTV